MYTGKRILYLLVFVASLLACNSPPEKPLRVGTIPWAGFELLYLARDLRYYDNTQIQLKELASSTETLYAFRQGQLDAIDRDLAILDHAFDLAARGDASAREVFGDPFAFAPVFLFGWTLGFWGWALLARAGRFPARAARLSTLRHGIFFLLL